MRITLVGGAGGVGASVALNILRGPGAHEVVLIDREPAMVQSHVQDLEQVCAFDGRHRVEAGTLADVPGSDLVVVTAGAPFRLNASRLEFLQENAQILQGVLDVLPSAWPGVLLVVTNPVDPLVTWIQQRSGLPRERVIGYTINDSLRLRCGIATAIGAHPADVDAWVIGEHGDVMVPLWDRVRVDGTPTSLTGAQRDAADDFLRGWYRRHVALDSGRSSTWTSGAGVARMIDAIASGDGAPWTASVVLQGEYGHDGIALSVPVRLGPGGIREVLEWELDPGARAEIARAADVVAQAAGQLAQAAPEPERA